MGLVKEEAKCCVPRTVHRDKVERALKKDPGSSKISRLSLIFKALGDPNRLKLLLALKNEEMCVCDLAAFLESSESAVSHQLRKLRDLFLVKNRRDGQILYYSLDDEHVSRLLEMGIEHVEE